MGTEGVTTFDVSPHDALSNVLLSCVTFEAFWSAAQTSSQDALDISSGDAAAASSTHSSDAAPVVSSEMDVDTYGGWAISSVHFLREHFTLEGCGKASRAPPDSWS